MAFFSDILFSVPLLSCMMSDRESFLIKKKMYAVPISYKFILRLE